MTWAQVAHEAIGLLREMSAGAAALVVVGLFFWFLLRLVRLA